jgi:Tol biopolymer transport system component
MSFEKRSTGTRVILAVLLATLATTAAIAQSATTQGSAQPFTVDDLVRLKRLSDPQVSPDGRYVAYVLRETDMDANKGRTDIWLLDLAQKDAQPRRLTTDPANDTSPRWAPDSRTLYFLSTRGGSSQVWHIRIDGGEATRVTNYPVDVGALKVSPRGDLLAVSM